MIKIKYHLIFIFLTMRWFTAIQVKPTYFMRELTPVDLFENNEWLLKTSFWDFEIPIEFSDRVRMLLDEKIPKRYSSYTELSTWDCHSFSWWIVTWSISIKNWAPWKKELSSAWLLNIKPQQTQYFPHLT